ncbi:MAG TPA: hypothetical protein PLK28_12910 [Candidatus Rifleibacterium sp.]|nr:hypothetical protein [Candidatus Rifleibacterium sp.]
MNLQNFFENISYLRHKTGIIELPVSEIPWAFDFARREELKAVDWVEWKVLKLKNKTEMMGREMALSSIKMDIEKIVEEEISEIRPRAIINLDIALASQSNENIINFWEWMAQKFRPQASLLIILPQNAEIVLPYHIRTKWIAFKRLYQIRMEDME